SLAPYFLKNGSCHSENCCLVESFAVRFVSCPSARPDAVSCWGMKYPRRTGTIYKQTGNQFARGKNK
ncbi:MAG: hypothetical protein BJ554DRAFT_5864, partial [Olpidium bornovanus]